MKVKFLGGAREVGRAAITFKTEKTQLLLDYGVMINHEPGFPMHVPSKDVDGIILTHSHLDHSGAVPIFYVQERKPVYGTQLTFDLANLLISDFIRLSGYYIPYEYLELQTMIKNCTHLDYREKQTLGDVQFQLLESGHIPGGAQALVEANGRRFIYTSDYNTVDTRLLNGADRNYGKIDTLVIESTYADEDHVLRTALEKEFLDRTTEVVENGGTVLVPAFSVGRSQEIVCILAAYHCEHSMIVDGMAREANRIMMKHASYMRDPQLFMNAMHAATWVEGWRDRRMAVQKPGIIISPAGMLKGGPAAFYIQKLGKKRQNAVFLVGYQIPGTPGRELLDEGKCLINGKIHKIKAQLRRFDFSSHSGASQLQETIRKVEGNPNVYVTHGSEEKCETFARWINEHVGLEAVAPKSGDIYEV